MRDTTLTFQQRSLFQQGYQRYTPQELRQLQWGLRFTPAVCSAVAAAALFGQHPSVLFLVGGLGLWAFFFPAFHPMDLMYNYGIRRLFGAVGLPANPLQRRLACLSAGIMNLTAGSLFLLDMPRSALFVGGILLALQSIVIATHFCVLSWLYEWSMRLLGRWQIPVDCTDARHLFLAGAKLIDVRSPEEHQRDELPGTINVPLERLLENLDQFRRGPALLYCASGMRAHIALEKLRSAGINTAFNLGTTADARKLVARFEGSAKPVLV